MGKKLTYEYVKEYFEKEGCELLTLKEDYKNTKIKLVFKCSCNTIENKTFDNFRYIPRCKKCSRILLTKNTKYDQKYVDEYFLKFGYKNNSIYKNIVDILEITCPNGHSYKSTFRVFENGCRCGICFGNKKLNIDYIKEQVEKYNYICVSEDYIGASEKITLICPNKHIIKMKWNGFQQGARCRKCYELNNKGENHPCCKKR
jgi:hypothetical protein